MKKTKLEKGITLVALIITIVVLLILAVVSIGAVKNSGIIGHATNTTTRWEQEKDNETSDLQEYETYIASNIPGGNGGVTGTAYKSERSKISIIITSDDKVISVNANGEIILNRGKITYIDNVNVTDRDDIVFSKFFIVEDGIAIMGLAEGALYNLERRGEEGNYTYLIQDTFVLNESIDISEYLK